MFDPREMERMEAPLVALANQSGGDLRKLLYAFFGFLHRRTDFYMVPSAEDDDAEGGGGGRSSRNMGFPEGDAEKLLLAAFRQFPLRRIPPRSTSSSSSSPPSSQTPASKVSQSPSSVKEKPSSDTASSTIIPSDTDAPAVPSIIDATTPTTSPGKTPTMAELEGFSALAPPESCTNDSPSVTSPSIRYTEEGLQMPVGNGGTADRYTWTQTLEECTVLLGGLPDTCRARDLEVTFTSTTLAVKSKAGTPPIEYLAGTLTQRIVPSESTWTLEGGILIVVLYKHVKTFWSAVLEGDPAIDTSLVDSRRHIGEYDESTQAQIRKIMFDQAQARKGLPTSDELTGTKPSIPPTLPPGVEYIDQTVLDQATQKKLRDGTTGPS